MITKLFCYNSCFRKRNEAATLCSTASKYPQSSGTAVSNGSLLHYFRADFYACGWI
ncbi:hypothetical protein GCK32_008839 [Trichostrongylus colubriformis]|uniref:Uncharacterized protein n=1 Tax=Trichostrongylus colubriformis TaxID=6319 RepID=A0AAN8FNP5_TRICO